MQNCQYTFDFNPVYFKVQEQVENHTYFRVLLLFLSFLLNNLFLCFIFLLLLFYVLSFIVKQQKVLMRSYHKSYRLVWFKVLNSNSFWFCA